MPAMGIKTTERTSILNEDGVFSLVIFPVREKWKLNLLFAWWILWTFCGIVFIGNYISMSRAPEYAQLELHSRLKNNPEDRVKIIQDVRDKLDKNQQKRLVLLIVIAFWAYYEFKVGRAYFFRKFGHEKIWMKDGKVYYKREINKKGRTKTFDAEFIKEFTVLEYNKHDFFQSMSRSFWTLAGETIAFDYHAKTMRFGIQLDENEAKEIAVKLNKALKRTQQAAVTA